MLKHPLPKRKRYNEDGETESEEGEEEEEDSESESEEEEEEEEIDSDEERAERIANRRYTTFPQTLDAQWFSILQYKHEQLYKDIHIFEQPLHDEHILSTIFG